MHAGFVFSDAANLRCSWVPLAISLGASVALFMPAMRTEIKAALAALVSSLQKLLQLFWDPQKRCFGSCGYFRYFWHFWHFWCCCNRRAVVAPQPLPTESNTLRRSAVQWRTTGPWKPQRAQQKQRKRSSHHSARTLSQGSPQNAPIQLGTPVGSHHSSTASLGRPSVGYGGNSEPVCSPAPVVTTSVLCRSHSEVR